MMILRQSKEKAATTLVGILVGAALFSLLIAFVARTVRLQKLSGNALQRLDTLQTMRITERKLRSALEMGTTVLYPPAEGGAKRRPSSYLVFTGQTNLPTLLYLDGEGALKIKVRGRDPEILCHGVKALVVRHQLEGHVWCSVSLGDTVPSKMGFAVSVHLANGFCGVKGASS